MLVRQYGETFEYWESGTACRDVTGIVERNQVAIMAEVGEILTQSIIIRVPNNDTEGIDASKIDSGRCKVVIALTEGGESVPRSIVQILSAANGFVRFLVQ
jgi:hypothetical protein